METFPLPEGITVEIVREALKRAGHRLIPSYLNLDSLNLKIRQSLDAHAQVESRNLAGFYSQPIVVFETSLIGLKSRPFRISSPEDLTDKSLLAFQGAGRIFESVLQKPIRNGMSYREVSDQELQTALLYQGRAELILADLNIFFFYKRHNRIADCSAPHVLYEVPGLSVRSPAFAVFHDQGLRDAFDLALAGMKADGSVDKIQSVYRE